ncbi:MAG: leucine-rich repeat domain-containing protein [Oscillospiraceae bacterium]|nr:leucine-rich repeat domain-containing protein [Oscillospiraceae bacterium]
MNCKAKTKRAAALLFMLALLLAALPPLPALAAEGACGQEVYWTLEEGVLTISGQGAMYSYADETGIPWYDQRDTITQLIVEEGVTGIGARALYGCTALVRVVLPDSVEQIGQMAFMNCENLMFLTLGGGLASIGSAAFRGCTSLSALKLPESLQTLGSEAFYRCSALTSVELPAGVCSMGVSVFAYCTGLIRAVVACEIETLPDWTFYGCTALSGVTLGDTITSAGDRAFYGCESLGTLRCSADAKQTLAAAARQGNPDLWDGSISSSYGESVSASYSATETDGDWMTTTVVTADETAAATLTTTLIYTYSALENSGESAVTGTVRAVLEDDSGWEDLLAELERVQSVQTAYTGDEDAAAPDVEIALKGEPVIPAETLTALEAAAGQITVVINNGLRWLLAEDIVLSDRAEQLNLGAALTPCESVPKALRGSVDDGCYALVFDSDIDSRVQLTLALPAALSGQTAGFFSGSTLLQAAWIESSGAVTFGLSSASAGRTYYIGVNPADSGDVLLSSQAAQEGGLGAVEYIDADAQYPAAGGSTFFRLVLLVIGLVICAVVVAAGLILLHRRRLRLRAEKKTEYHPASS